MNLGALLDRSGDPERALFLDPTFGDRAGAVTVAAFDARCDAVARGLCARGLQRGDRVAIVSDNRTDYVALFMGAMRAGIVPVPVNHKLPAAGIARIVRDAGARLVVFDGPRAAALDGAELAGARLAGFDDPGPDGFAALLDPGPFRPVDPRPDEAAFMIFTSGSTGRPKGVLLSHAAHRWTAEVRARDMPVRGERLLIAAPLYHMNALALALLVCAGGAECVLMPRFDARAAIDAISRFSVTWLTAVPPMIAMMLREEAALAQADLGSVHTVRMGSAPVTDALAARIARLLPNARIVNAYGTTEGGPVVFAPHPDGRALPVGSVGHPHPEVEVRLTGPDAPWSGVLQMRSPALMLGYHDRPDVASPITADGFLDTGDVFRRDADGFHFFLGRNDDMFVSGGENIFPGEVERAIETHPDVVQSCVVPVPDPVKGTKPVAFVVRRAGSALDEATLKAHVLERAPAYQHPRRVWFVEAMPAGAASKIDRAALRARAARTLGAPD